MAEAAIRNAPDSVPVLELRGVTRVLPGPVPVTLVRDINLKIPRATFAAITGPSGSGKSSLLYLLSLLDRPTSGEVLLEGRAIDGLSDAARAGIRLKKLGFVFQFHFLLPEFTALDNVMLPMRKARLLEPRAMRARALDLLHQLDLDDSAHKLPGQLSGGQRQRVAIARALANDPHVIFADEPTGNLDTKNGRIVFDIFERLVDVEGRSVVTVTHDPDLAARAEMRIHIVDGRIV
ncbi:ABC transporter ATP-binding protein [Pelagibius litoralis]|uniref:ABC transporter ATP-binding protein n=1 Tax=Pelagibius litoralis TaxID=374515 RepID=A0A967EX81_9PROT|nr:ABC transporter ATP-binding protein [Pelagibius litoralis]NIA68180.1 ABC transporter ATP-binding protein [Pelagibius litoralis]